MFRFHPVGSWENDEEWNLSNHKPPRGPMKMIVAFIWLAVIGWLLLAFTSCSFTVAADGAKSFNLDGEQAAKAIRVLTEK